MKGNQAELDSADLIEAGPVKELSEAEQIKALTQGLGLDDPNLAGGHGLTGFGEDADQDNRSAFGGGGTRPHERQAHQVETEEMKGFGQGERPAPTQVKIVGGAKPTGHGQPIPQAALVGRPGHMPPPVVGRPGVNAPPGPPGVVGRELPKVDVEGIKDRAQTSMGFAAVDRMFPPPPEPVSLNAPAYPPHPGEDLPAPAFTQTQGQVNTLSRLLDSALPNPQSLITAVALKASVTVAGVEGVEINFSSAELADIDRRATFWGLSRAESIQKMFDQVKSYMFESSSM